MFRPHSGLISRYILLLLAVTQLFPPKTVAMFYYRRVPQALRNSNPTKPPLLSDGNWPVMQVMIANPIPPRRTARLATIRGVKEAKPIEKPTELGRMNTDENEVPGGELSLLTLGLRPDYAFKSVAQMLKNFIDSSVKRSIANENNKLELATVEDDY